MMIQSNSSADIPVEVWLKIVSFLWPLEVAKLLFVDKNLSKLITSGDCNQLYWKKSFQILIQQFQVLRKDKKRDPEVQEILNSTENKWYKEYCNLFPSSNLSTELQLFSAIETSNLPRFKRKIESFDQLNEDDELPLSHFIAVKSDQLFLNYVYQMACRRYQKQKSLVFEVDCNERDKFNNTIMHWAILCRQPLVVLDDLIQLGCDLNALNDAAITPFNLAIIYNYRTAVEHLISSASKNKVAISFEESILIAAKHGRAEILKFLLTIRTQNNAVYQFDSLTLSLPQAIAATAVKFDQEPILKIFLQESVEIMKFLAVGAIVNNSINCAPILLNSIDINGRYEALITEPNRSSETTLLHLAAETGDREICALLLQRGAAVNITLISGITPLYLAAQNKRAAVFGLLLEYGAVPNDEEKDYLNTLLYKAASKGNVTKVQYYLRLGADIHMRHFLRSPATVLEAAAQSNHDTVLNELFFHAKFDDEFLESILEESIKFSRIKTAEVLLDKGVRCLFALHLAAVHSSNFIPLLLKYKYAIDEINPERETALHFAVRKDKVHSVIQLLQNKAGINAVNNNEQTPLMIAVEFARDTIANILLEGGAHAIGYDFAKSRNALHNHINTLENEFLQQEKPTNSFFKFFLPRPKNHSPELEAAKALRDFDFQNDDLSSLNQYYDELGRGELNIIYNNLLATALEIYPRRWNLT